MNELKGNVLLSELEKEVLVGMVEVVDREDLQTPEIWDNLPGDVNTLSSKLDENLWAVHLTKKECNSIRYLCEYFSFTDLIEGFSDEECEKLIEKIEQRLVATFSSEKIKKQIQMFRQFLEKGWICTQVFEEENADKKRLTFNWVAGNWEMLVGRVLLENNTRANPFCETFTEESILRDTTILEDESELSYILCKTKDVSFREGYIAHLLCTKNQQGEYEIAPPFDYVKASTLSGESRYFSVDEVDYIFFPAKLYDKLGNVFRGAH